MSVEGMHNYFIQKLSRDDSRDKVSADELNGLHRSSSQRTLKTRLVTQITWHTLLRPFYFRTNLWAEYVFKASSIEPERLSCGVFRASECSKRLRCFFRYSSMLFLWINSGEPIFFSQTGWRSAKRARPLGVRQSQFLTRSNVLEEHCWQRWV